jgi:hypothetical protein
VAYPQPGDSGEAAVQLYWALIGLLAGWRRTTAEPDNVPDHGAADARARCRTPGCAADPDCWDGFCGESANRGYSVGFDDEPTADAACNGASNGSPGGAQSG